MKIWMIAPGNRLVGLRPVNLFPDFHRPRRGVGRVAVLLEGLLLVADG